MIPFSRTTATVAEAAAEWGVSAQMVRNWIREGKVQGYLMGRQFILGWPQNRPALSTERINKPGKPAPLFSEE